MVDTHSACKLNDRCTTLLVNPNSVETEVFMLEGMLIDKIRSRSRWARRIAFLGVIVVITIVVFMILFFYQGSDIYYEISTSLETSTMDLISRAATIIIRLASAALAVYLIQVLVGFTRYQFRISDHLDTIANAIELSSGDPEALRIITSAISPQHIQFGKMPATPMEQGAEIIRELINKIPSKL